MSDRVRAIEAVAKVVRRSREAEPSRRANLRAALGQVSRATQHHSKGTVRELLEMIEGMMLRPVDPSEIPCNVFRMFEISGSEVAWTKWLAAMLSPEQGSQLSALVWRSLCDAIAEQELEPCPIDRREELASRATWRKLRDAPPERGHVKRERHHVRHGRTDIEVRTPKIFLILENKLDAGWHDSDGGRQLVRYRKIGITGCVQSQRLGLVVLTKNPKLELGKRCEDWLKITYRDLARALRGNLREALGRGASAPRLLDLWPALLTVTAIEQDLLGLDIAQRRDTNSRQPWLSITPLVEVISHLRTGEE